MSNKPKIKAGDKYRIAIHAAVGDRKTTRSKMAKTQGNHHIQDAWRKLRRTAMTTYEAHLFDIANGLKGKNRQRMLDKLNVRRAVR